MKFYERFLFRRRTFKLNKYKLKYYLCILNCKGMKSRI